MSRHRLPELDITLGRATRLADAAVRVSLALVALLLAGGTVVVARTGLGESLRALSAFLGGGG